MDITTQDTIEKYIVPHLSVGSRGKSIKESTWRIVATILYRLKTGCQWKMLPMREFFDEEYSWNSVYYHWRQWSADGSWMRVWQSLLSTHKNVLDLSNINVDGTHTKSVKGGKAVGYQKRKKTRTSNMLTLSDTNGLPIALSEPQSGEHHDVYRIEHVMTQLISSLEEAEIPVEGLFLNADAGFDCATMKTVCTHHQIELNVSKNRRNSSSTNQYEYFDHILYIKRGAIERSYAWLDSFRSIIIRYEVLVETWKNLNILACIQLFIKRLLKQFSKC
jgi:transposase